MVGVESIQADSRLDVLLQALMSPAVHMVDPAA
jgi:hypothetical protein